jgi:hypothetical protein
VVANDNLHRGMASIAFASVSREGVVDGGLWCRGCRSFIWHTQVKPKVLFSEHVKACEGAQHGMNRYSQETVNNMVHRHMAWEEGLKWRVRRFGRQQGGSA